MESLWIISILILSVAVGGAHSGVCPRIKSKFCTEITGLGYDKTFFPNLMGHMDQKAAKSAMKPYEALADTGCSPYIRAFICASFLPACPTWKDVPKKPQKPCRELCERARKDCEATLIGQLEMEWPTELNCEELPSHDPSRRNPVCTNFVPARPDYTPPTVASMAPTMSSEPKDGTSRMITGTRSATSSAVPPAADGSTVQTSDGSTMSPDMDSNTMAPAGDGSTMASRTVGNTMAPVGDGSTVEPPMNGSTMAPSGDGSSSVPDMDSSTMAPAVDGRSTGPPMSGSTMAVSGHGSSMAPDMDGSTMSPAVDGSGPTMDDGTMSPAMDASTMGRVMDGSTMSSPVNGSTMLSYMEASTMAPSTETMDSTMTISTEPPASTLQPDGLPVIRKAPDNVVVTEGSSVEFRCIAVGATEYSWKRIDGEYPLEKVDMEDYHRLQGAVLRMIDLSVEDDGIYACVASNQDGYVEALVTLTVVVAPTIATIPTPQLVNEGDKLVIECKGEGVPPPTIIWERKDGKNVKSKGQGSKRSLIIKRADSSDAGIYYCVAINQAGHANYTVDVQINGPVVIVEDIPLQTIQENETAFFVCTATGNPQPEFSWRRLDGPFPDENRVVVEGPIVNTTLGYPIYTSILGIEPAIGSDTGSYQCYAYNSVGNYTAVGDLIVEGPPGFLKKPDAERFASVGDSVEFSCMASGAPPFMISWSKEEDEEWPREDSRITMEEGNTILRIGDVTPADSGMYVCTISNEMGEMSASSTLQVEGGSTISLSPSEGASTSRDDEGSTMASATEATSQMRRNVSTSGEETTVTDEMKSTSSDKTGSTDIIMVTVKTEQAESSVETEITSGPVSMTSKESEQPMSSMGMDGSTDPMASPEPSASPESMASNETSDSQEPVASPEPSSSPEPMASPESSASPEAMASKEPTASTKAESEKPMSSEMADSTEPTVTPDGMMEGSTMSKKSEMMAEETTHAMMSSKASEGESGSTMMPATEPLETTPVKPRRTDIRDPGERDLFQGWVDVQGQGAANDFCRIIGTDSTSYQLVCSLAGTEGEEEFNYVSKKPFDIGEKDTFYMKDENEDGRDDYCRCTGKTGRRYVWCTAAGQNGFYGNEEMEPGTSQHSFKAEGDKNELRKCRRRFVDPFFGIPY